MKYNLRKTKIFGILMFSLYLIFIIGCSNHPDAEPEIISGRVMFPTQPDSLSEKLNTLNMEYDKDQILTNNRIKVLEDKCVFTDSLLFEFRADMTEISSRITRSGKQSKNPGNTNNYDLIKPPGIPLDEYRESYVEALGNYQNGRYSVAQKIFTNLLEDSRIHELSDNCQYWIAEIYYARKDYHQSIIEFEKVFTFSGTNKADHSRYKLGLCYLNTGQYQNARSEFEEHINSYPNSDLYQSSIDYLNKF